MVDTLKLDPVATSLEEAAENLDRLGVAVLRQYLPYRQIKAVQHRMWDLVTHLYSLFGKGKHRPGDRKDAAVLDAMLLELYRSNPRYESFVYDTSRHLPEVAAMLDSTKIMDAIRTALQVAKDRPIAVNNRNVRIDLPGEDWNENLPWHQDYPYRNPLYTPGRSLATWSPIFPCPLDLGPAIFKTRSHRAGEISDLPHSNGENRTLAWTIAPEHLDDASYEDWQSEVDVGDLIIFSLTTIHRSGINRSESRVRWSLQARYHDVLCEPFTRRYE